MKTRLVTIELEEYEELLKFKEMVEEANNSFNKSRNYPPSIEKATDYIPAPMLFDYLKQDDYTQEVVLKSS
jgi:hypothetical protein